MFSLYVHVPFCKSRCPYCDFAFDVGKTHLAGRYAAAVIREMRTRLSEMGGRMEFDTVYFGGGTPSEVPPDSLRRILDAARSMSRITPGAEISAEANPEDRSRFAQMAAIGISRLSLGVQAMDSATLRALGRRHTPAEAGAAVDAARRAGLSNLNIDLIFSAPRQTVSVWRETLDRAIDLFPEHVSVYGLTVEPGTAFGRRMKKGRLPLPPEDTQAEMYEAAQEKLCEAGYVHYEVSNFAQPGFACRHNIACWERQAYLGVGLSAHSFFNDRRTWNIRPLMAYIGSVESSGVAIAGEEAISSRERRVEQVMLGLRRANGIPERLLGASPGWTSLIPDHLFERDDGRVRLTRRGLLLADLVCAKLLTEMEWKSA
ncbi:MAG: radical SAM family heme chaperone HemW [Gemmatimonadota bacterium]|nr:radical SAM family heme chaperone HemW [Gemmatimonadota bacterium]